MTTLPMVGLTHGNRSAVTCHLKCGSACALPAPNPSTEPTFRDVVSASLSRRQVLLGAGALAAGTALAGLPDPAGAAPTRTGGLAFDPIPPVQEDVDALTVPTGYRWHPILRWGDPLFDDSPRFDPTRPSGAAQEAQFGYNNDYLDILVDRSGREALLVCNHEYTNREIMFPPTASATEEAEVVRALMAAHGMSVVELARPARGRRWRYVRGGRRNRRVTATTPFRMTGPAAGSDLLRTAADPSGYRALGTFNNCSGGTTPWGTILSGEENTNNYFLADPDDPRNRRYGLTTPASGRTTYQFETVDPRFDARQGGYANEPHRHGWIVELDPYEPTSTPRKHTAMGRFKHEGANVRVDRDGAVAAYMGDDERFDYLYKFVSRRRFRSGRSAAARRHNLTLLTEGDLFVAKFLPATDTDPDVHNLGTGTWIPLTRDGESAVPGFSAEEVLVFTRLAADAVGATPMDRPEDVQPSPRTGRIYVACTNNVDRGVRAGRPGPDAANPRPANKDGHVIEISERDDRADATEFTWDLFLVCGDPADQEVQTYFGGYPTPVTPISCPDNVAFDSVGNLWLATDGQPSALELSDGLFRVPVRGPQRGRVDQFLAVPRGAETCGPVIRDRDRSVFVAVQHPGEGGTWTEPTSLFPDYVAAGKVSGRGQWRGPRPSVVQVVPH